LSNSEGAGKDNPRLPRERKGKIYVGKGLEGLRFYLSYWSVLRGCGGRGGIVGGGYLASLGKEGKGELDR